MLSKGFILSSLLVALSVTNVFAVPVEGVPADVEKRSSAALSSSQIASYTPYSHFASTAYCSPSTTVSWKCGTNCAANADFIPTASGGDGSSVQYWYVGYSPSLSSVIVAHQGTDPSSIQADATDANAILGTLDSSLFPGISSAVEVHEGFRNSHAKSAAAILSAVKSTVSTRKATKVTLVGHSLGGALSLLDAIYLPLHLTGVTYRFVGYGIPRVGNQDFANYVDSHLSGSALVRVNNKEDFVPILPGRFLGYHHPSGEVHIQDDGSWVACSGQDNTNTQCTTGDVENVFDGSVGDHDGPYNGVQMGC